MYKEINNEYFFTLYLNNNLFYFPELENYIKVKICHSEPVEESYYNINSVLLNSFQYTSFFIYPL